MRENSTLKARILQYLECKGITKYECYKKTGMANGILSQSSGLSEDNLLRFLSYAQDISPIWLLTGEGEIFKTKCAENVNKGSVNLNVNKNVNVPNVQKTLTFENPKERHEQNTAPLSASTEFIEIPYADVDAAAGGGASNADYLDLSTVIRLPAAMLPSTRAQRLCINVTGESMEPTIPDGSLLIVKRVERSEYINIRDKHVYVVTDREGCTWVKRVENNLRTDGVLTLSSDGAYKRMYQPFDVEEGDIHNVWVAELFVTGTMSDCAAAVRRNDISIMQLDMAEFRTEIRAEMATVVALVKDR